MVDSSIILEWITYKNVSNTVILYMTVGDIELLEVTQSKVILWKTGGKLQSGKTLSWNIGQVRKSLDIGWSTFSPNLDVGNPKVTFWAVHTGENNSGQVIRFRSAKKYGKIVWQSSIEYFTLGHIRCFVGWKDPVIQDTALVNHLLYSDLELDVNNQPKGGYNIIRPTQEISSNEFPLYVYQEYASTQDPKYIIRYLGYMNSPFDYYNGPKRQTKLEDIVDLYGAALLPTNFSGRSYNVTIRFRNGQRVSGILPDKASIAVIKNDNGNYHVGYVPYEGLNPAVGPGAFIDAKNIKRYFKTFQ